MRKSSVYLSEELKVSLRNLSNATGRSEADLIRAAIERMVHEPDDARTARSAAHRAPSGVDLTRPGLWGVGIGPGPTDLVTERARTFLARADRVVVLSTGERSAGRAERTVRAAAPLAHIQRVVFDIADGDGRSVSLSGVATAVIAALDAGELVAVAVIGDPMQWTIFPALVERVRCARPTAWIGAVPGIMGYQHAAASSLTALGVQGSALVVADDASTISSRCASNDTVVLHKSKADGATVKRAAAVNGRTLIVVETESQSQPASIVDDGPLPYLATSILPPSNMAPSNLAPATRPATAPVKQP